MPIQFAPKDYYGFQSIQPGLVDAAVRLGQNERLKTTPETIKANTMMSEADQYLTDTGWAEGTPSWIKDKYDAYIGWEPIKDKDGKVTDRLFTKRVVPKGAPNPSAGNVVMKNVNDIQGSLYTDPFFADVLGTTKHIESDIAKQQATKSQNVMATQQGQSFMESQKDPYAKYAGLSQSGMQSAPIPVNIPQYQMPSSQAALNNAAAAMGFGGPPQFDLGQYAQSIKQQNPNLPPEYLRQMVLEEQQRQQKKIYGTLSPSVQMAKGGEVDPLMSLMRDDQKARMGDVVPANLTPGEGVLSVGGNRVAKGVFGKDFLNTLNKLGNMITPPNTSKQGYAGGVSEVKPKKTIKEQQADIAAGSNATDAKASRDLAAAEKILQKKRQEEAFANAGDSFYEEIANDPTLIPGYYETRKDFGFTSPGYTELYNGDDGARKNYIATIRGKARDFRIQAERSGKKAFQDYAQYLEKEADALDSAGAGLTLPDERPALQPQSKAITPTQQIADPLEQGPQITKKQNEFKGTSVSYSPEVIRTPGQRGYRSASEAPALNWAELNKMSPEDAMVIMQQEANRRGTDLPKQWGNSGAQIQQQRQGMVQGMMGQLGATQALVDQDLKNRLAKSTFGTRVAKESAELSNLLADVNYKKALTAQALAQNKLTGGMNPAAWAEYQKTMFEWKKTKQELQDKRFSLLENTIKGATETGDSNLKARAQFELALRKSPELLGEKDLNKLSESLNTKFKGSSIFDFRRLTDLDPKDIEAIIGRVTQDYMYENEDMFNQNAINMSSEAAYKGTAK